MNKTQEELILEASKILAEGNSQEDADRAEKLLKQAQEPKTINKTAPVPKGKWQVTALFGGDAEKAYDKLTPVVASEIEDQMRELTERLNELANQ